MSEVRARGIESEPEQEVDLRTLWARLVSRWWLPLAGLVLGAVAGVLVAVGGGQTWKAKTLLYLGQPFTPGGGGQIQSLSTNPRTVSEVVRSEAAIREAAAKSGLRVGQLRGSIATASVTSPSQTKAQSPLVEIAVIGPERLKVERATKMLAQYVVRSVSPYVDNKIELLKEEVKADEQELTLATQRAQAALTQLQQIQSLKSLTLTDRLLLQANANTSLNFYETRQTNLRNDLSDAKQLLSLAEQVERSRVVEPAVAAQTTARSRRNSAAIGALIGLILGGVAAYLADPVLARRNTLRAA